MYERSVKAIRSIFLGLTVNELAVWLNMSISCELHECEPSFQMIKGLPQGDTTLKVLSRQLPVCALALWCPQSLELTICRFLQVIVPRHGLSGDCVN